MTELRVIPVLLVARSRGGLVKGVRFRQHVYVGDPINAVKVFNDKSVDEIAIIDIEATPRGRAPDVRWIEEMCGEAFMPLAYGGGVRTVDDVTRALRSGAEKVIINTAAHGTARLVEQAARVAGSQSIVVAIDVKRSLLRGTGVYVECGERRTALSPVEAARRAEAAGAGEILVTSVDRDGTMSGYDLELVRSVAAAVRVPVIACGGAGRVEHFREARAAGASAVAAGALFVFVGRQRGVLINYPSEADLRSLRSE